MILDALLGKLKEKLRADLERTVTDFVATARTQLEGALAEVAMEHAKGLAEVAKEKADLHREIAAMHTHKEAQEGYVDLNIGGYRFQTSMQTLRRLSHSFFDAYFSGRYVKDVCDDGSIFIDRDGEHFGHVLEYMRGGVVSVAEPGAQPSMSLLRALKRDFDFYCIELMAEPQDVAFAVGGYGNDNVLLASVERYDNTSGAWQAAAPMAAARVEFGMCELARELYVGGGFGVGLNVLASVERYDPDLDTWSAAPAMPHPRYAHCACAVSDAMYVLGGFEEIDGEECIVGSVLRFDSRAQTWSEVAPMPAERNNGGACVVGNNVLIFGGCNNNNEATSTTYRFSTETNTWATLAPMPEAKCNHSVCVLDGLIYVMGGEDTDSRAANSIHRYNPLADSWREVAPMSVARTGVAAFVQGGSIHAAGGRAGSHRLASIERYCVTSDSWSEVASMGMERVALCAHVTRAYVGLFDDLMAKKVGLKRG
jgi:N-acetylneuraminic acid mutarotase